MTLFVAAACGPTVPSSAQTVISTAVASHIYNLGQGPNPSHTHIVKAWIDGVDVKDANFSGDTGYAHEWLRLAFWLSRADTSTLEPDATPPGGPEHNTLDDEFWLKKTGGTWTIIKEEDHGYAPGGGP